MSTSLREQLLRLQTPQSSQFVDTRKRDSILFTSKDAATKSRETIYEIGLSGLHELIEMDNSFAEFENTLFNLTARDVQRAVETTEVNKLLNENIKRFMFRLSPYFMIPSAHKCLEWLIRRFNINLYNKEEMFMLILPYHQTNMFVRCIQIMKFDDPSDKWNFMAEIKKSSTPLSKMTIWNHGASYPAFLDFVGRFTYDAVKEFDHEAGKLQTMFSFYFTTCAGALEQASNINDNHILSIANHLIKTYKSNIVDYIAAGYMITAQLVSKVNLSLNLLYKMMERLTKNINPKLASDCVMLLSLIFQTQSDELKITDKVLENLLAYKKLPNVLRQVKDDDKIITEFLRAFIYKLLIKLQETDGNSKIYSEICEKLLNEIDMDDELACVIIRTVLDSYVENDVVQDEGKSYLEEEVISLDSDDENIPLKSQEITKWFSTLLKSLERRYPTAFDLVVKDVIARNPRRKRNGLKNVLGFLMNVSCSNNETDVFENLYHHNPNIRSGAVKYLVENFNKIEQTPENKEILRMTFTERLSDDSPSVVAEILRMDSKFLIEVIGIDELVAKLTRIIMKYWNNPEKWEEPAALSTKILAVNNDYSDSNIVMLSLLPFIFPCNKNPKTFSLKKNSSNLCSIMHKLLEDHAKVPSRESLVATIQNVLIDSHRLGSFSENFAFYLLARSLGTTNDLSFTLSAFETIRTIVNAPNVKFNSMDINNPSIMSSHEISIKVLSNVLIALVKSTSFSDYRINFLDQNIEMKLMFEVFNFLIDLFFKVDSSMRNEANDILVQLLDQICDSNETKKLKFLSQFCLMHAALGGKYLMLQIRTMGLFNFVLKSGEISEKHFSNEMYQNILVSLASPIAKTREFGVDILNTLHDQNIGACWRHLVEKIVERKDEIIMDSEQIKMIIYLLANKKSSKYIQEIVDSILKRVSDAETFEYVQAELLTILKHFTDRKVLDVTAKLATKIIDNCTADVFFFNENQSTIIKLVLMNISQETVGNLWDLAMKAINCHHLLNNEDKILTPSILLLQSIDSELFGKLHTARKQEIFTGIIECSMNEQARVVQAAQKVFFNISLDYKMIQNVLVNLPKSFKENENIGSSKQWKFGVTLLELLQNKSKGTQGQHELLPSLFDLLATCLQTPDESEIEYVKQIVLSLILTICKTISPDGRSHQKLSGINSSVFKTELIIKCVKESQNPQTHHHSLLLLAHIALMFPEQVLRDITTIFTFVGTALVRQDDSYSFQIITKIIENIIPNLLKSGQEKEVISILKTFAAIVLDVPIHRRIALYVKLLDILQTEKYLWMFIACLLETEVRQHKKSKEEEGEDLPLRLQTALTITKQFDIKTIIMSTTSLISYLKELPIAIDTNKLKSSSNVESEIFPLDTHSNKNLRHFKYLIALYVKNILASPEVVSKTNQMNPEQVVEMKAHFQSLILNTLIWLPDVNKSIEMKQNEVFWQLILQIYFEILEAAIALLAPDMLLIVVEKLIAHDNLIVRKKVIELLNRKLEDNYFIECDNRKVLNVIVPLKNVCETIGMDEVNPLEENIQQHSLVSIKLLAKILAEENPDQFVECLNHLTIVMNNSELRKSTMINLLDCMAELITNLKVHSIAMLGKVIPNLVKLLMLPKGPSYHVLYSAVSALLRIIESVPLFMSPYLVQIISQLITIAPELDAIKDAKISCTVVQIQKIWELLSHKVPLRILYPAVDELYDATTRNQQYNSVEWLMKLMTDVFKHGETKDIRNHQAELSDFFMKVLRFRSEVSSKQDIITFEQVNTIEQFIVQALIALILKLTEGSFRPLFENITNWAIKDKEDDDNRLITFYKLTNEVSSALKSLFLIFASDVVEYAGPFLNKCNSSKATDGEKLCFGENTEKNLCLAENILQTLLNLFTNDHQNFMNARRFDIVMQPIVDQIENEDALRHERIRKLIEDCTTQLAVAVSDDILWKQLNYQVLLKTRSNNSAIRIFAVEICSGIAKQLSQDFESLVPESIPFLSELLEDEDHTVVEACQNSIRKMEAVLNESLQKYF